MNTKAGQLIEQVKQSREAYLQIIANITESTAQYQPDEQSWNIVAITEHLYWAEHGGIAGMWKVLLAIRNNEIPATTTSAQQHMSISELIAATWKEKEQVPAVAAPRMGGSIGFWREAFSSLQPILDSFGHFIHDEELLLQAHPHPISGEMNFKQRLEFLRFHIDRHADQVRSVLEKAE